MIRSVYKRLTLRHRSVFVSNISQTLTKRGHTSLGALLQNSLTNDYSFLFQYRGQTLEEEKILQNIFKHINKIPPTSLLIIIQHYSTNKNNFYEQVLSRGLRQLAQSTDSLPLPILIKISYNNRYFLISQKKVFRFITALCNTIQRKIEKLDMSDLTHTIILLWSFRKESGAFDSVLYCNLLEKVLNFCLLHPTPKHYNLALRTITHGCPYKPELPTAARKIIADIITETQSHSSTLAPLTERIRIIEVLFSWHIKKQFAVSWLQEIIINPEYEELLYHYNFTSNLTPLGIRLLTCFSRNRYRNTQQVKTIMSRLLKEKHATNLILSHLMEMNVALDKMGFCCPQVTQQLIAKYNRECTSEYSDPTFTQNYIDTIPAAASIAAVLRRCPHLHEENDIIDRIIRTTLQCSSMKKYALQSHDHGIEVLLLLVRKGIPESISNAELEQLILLCICDNPIAMDFLLDYDEPSMESECDNFSPKRLVRALENMKSGNLLDKGVNVIWRPSKKLSLLLEALCQKLGQETNGNRKELLSGIDSLADYCQDVRQERFARSPTKQGKGQWVRKELEEQLKTAVYSSDELMCQGHDIIWNQFKRLPCDYYIPKYCISYNILPNQEYFPILLSVKEDSKEEHQVTLQAVMDSALSTYTAHYKKFQWKYLSLPVDSVDRIKDDASLRKEFIKEFISRAKIVIDDCS